MRVREEGGMCVLAILCGDKREGGRGRERERERGRERDQLMYMYV